MFECQGSPRVGGHVHPHVDTEPCMHAYGCIAVYGYICIRNTAAF